MSSTQRSFRTSEQKSSKSRGLFHQATAGRRKNFTRHPTVKTLKSTVMAAETIGKADIVIIDINIRLSKGTSDNLMATEETNTQGLEDIEVTTEVSMVIKEASNIDTTPETDIQDLTTTVTDSHHIITGKGKTTIILSEKINMTTASLEMLHDSNNGLIKTLQTDGNDQFNIRDRIPEAMIFSQDALRILRPW